VARSVGEIIKGIKERVLGRRQRKEEVLSLLEEHGVRLDEKARKKALENKETLEPLLKEAERQGGRDEHKQNTEEKAKRGG